MSPLIESLTRQVQNSDVGGCASPGKPYWRQSAVILAKWRTLESMGHVRLRAEYDDDVEPDFDEYDADRDGVPLGSIGEYRLDLDSDDWTVGDSCWGHVGYDNVLDWKENVYIMHIMDETMKAFKTNRKPGRPAEPK